MAATLSGPSRLRARRRRPPLAEINVTPFVDVMLVLLVVFMVTAPLLTTGVAVDLPEGSRRPLPGSDAPLVVSVTRDGRVFVEERELVVGELAPVLQALAAENGGRRVFVRGDRAADYGTVVAVVSALKEAGFVRVALVTEPPRTAARPPDPTTRTR